MATESRNSQWQPDYNTIFRSDNIHRRLFDGWGAACGNIKTNGKWSATERQLHINVLELKGAMLGIQSLLKSQSSKIISDINHKGGIHSPELLQVALQLWNWCDKMKTDPISASLNSILSFLADCFDEGLQYRSLNVLRSALSSTHPKIDGYPVGQHPHVLNFMKGILNNRPPKPRYSYRWDVAR